MLGEDDPLLVARLGVVEVFAELFELRLVALGVNLLGQGEQGLDLVPLCDQLGEGNGDDTAECLHFGNLVFLFAVLGSFLVAGFVLEHVLDVVQIALHRRQLGSGDFASPDRFDEAVELFQTSFERSKEGVRRARQPALKDRHGEASRRAVEDAGAIVIVVDVVGRFVVERLLADLALREVVAEGVADAAGVDALAVEADHLFLGASDEVTASRVGRVGVEGVYRREYFGL